LRLYVAGRAPNSELARANLAAMLDTAGRRVRLEIVDVLEHPERAVRDGILVTPTLVRPGRVPARVVGNLSDRDGVRAALGLQGK